MVDRLLARGTAARRSRRCAGPRRASASTSSSRAVRLAGFARVVGRAARAAARARRARAGGGRRSPAAGRAPSRCSSSSARRSGGVVVGAGQGERGLVRAAELGPLVRRALGIARPAPAAYGGAEPGGDRRSATPSRRRQHGELADLPGAPSRSARRARLSVSAPTASRPRLEPGGLRPGGHHRRDLLELAGRLGERERLVEQRPASGSPRRARRSPWHASARARAAPASRAGDARTDSAESAASSQRPPVKLRTSAPAGDQAEPPVVEAALVAVLEARVQVAGDLVEAAPAQRRARRG